MRTRWFHGIVTVLVLAAPIGAAAAPKERAAEVIRKAGMPRGLCAVVGDKGCGLALEIARQSEWTVLVHLADAADVRAACEAADEAGLYGTRVFVSKGPPTRIPLANDLADVVVAPGPAGGAAKAEVLRVLRPGGKALAGGEAWPKPAPDGTDDWSHHYHGPDNNPQSADRLARAPYLTQFVVEPRYGPAPQAVVAAAGRIFMAFGHVAWHQREEPWLNTLVALNGYNGTMLWKRALPKGIMVDRSTMIATPTTLYLADEKSCKLIDPATGKVTGEIAPPADLAGGTFWKWMGMEGGVLYALVGPAERMDDEARWRRRAHGWPWGGISKGYNDQEYRWGFAATLLAIDLKTKKVLWHHKGRKGDPPIDSRLLCMKAGRVFIGSFGSYLACLDAANGSVLWRKDAKKEPDYFKAMGPFSKGHGYRSGWKSTIYARCSDKALYIMGPQLQKLQAISAEDGKQLWSLPAKINVHVVIRPEGLYTVGAQNVKNETRKVDPMTGKVLATYDVWRRACTRATGSADGILFRASGGTCRLDLGEGKPQWMSPMRPACHIGVVIANGYLYWTPWVCDCNLQMFGTICCGPAGDFAFEANAVEAERLEALVTEIPADKKKPRPRRRWAPRSWSTYLGDNALSAQTTWHGMSVPQDAAVLWDVKPRHPFEPTAPVTVGGTVYLGGRDGTVRAMNASSGRPRWRAYTGGAILYPPTIAAGRALVGSGDGCVYAFDAADGKLLWRFRAAPAERWIPLYRRLQSIWPVHSGVIVDRGVAYLAAGMTDYDGTHLYALDVKTGKIKWQNHTSGHLDRFSRRGAAVQGHLLAHGGKLYLPGGNALSPVVYDMKTGKCLSGPPEGFGTRAPRGRELRLVGGQVRVSGQPLYSDPEHPVYDNSSRWTPSILAGRDGNLMFVPGKGPKGDAWNLVAVDPFAARELWTQPLGGQPVRWGIAAEGSRIVVTLRGGRVVCIGPKPQPPGNVALKAR